MHLHFMPVNSLTGPEVSKPSAHSTEDPEPNEPVKDFTVKRCKHKAYCTVR